MKSIVAALLLLMLATMFATEAAAQDALWQEADGTRTDLSVSVNVGGMSGQGFASDTVGDVGLHHYVQAVNGGSACSLGAGVCVTVYDKQGNILEGPTALESLFTTGDCASSAEAKGDPIVLYDEAADRWLYAQFTDHGNGTKVGDLCIAVSVGPNPRPLTAANYHTYSYTTGVTGWFPDYIKISHWRNYYIGTAETGGENEIYIFDRAAMLSGSPDPAWVLRILPNPSIDGGGDVREARVLAADVDGAASGLGPALLVRTVAGNQDNTTDDDVLEIWELANVDFIAGTADLTLAQEFRSTGSLTGYALTDTSIGNRTGTKDCLRTRDVDQNGIADDYLDCQQQSILWRLQYRQFPDHETLVAQQGVLAGDGNNEIGIRWWVMRRPDGAAKWTLEEGTYAPQAAGASGNNWLRRWMGSAAMDGEGNLAVGYSIMDAATTDPVYPGVAISGKLAASPAGRFDQSEVVLTPGGADRVSPSVRWGDYSAMSVDPADGCTFWYTQMYIDATAGNNSGIYAFTFDTDGDGTGNACENDDDDDGVVDDSDNCPLIANADQADDDGDGFGNLCDNCAGTGNNQVDTDADGLGDACDGDQDGDGVVNSIDPCPLDPDDDADGDGICADLDCKDNGIDEWAVPSRVRNLRLSHTGGTLGTTTLQWTEPIEPGGTTPVYDVVSSDLPSNFVHRGTCVETDGTDTTAADSTTPAAGEALYYLVVAQTACGVGTAGPGSDDVERAVRVCR